MGLPRHSCEILSAIWNGIFWYFPNITKTEYPWKRRVSLLLSSMGFLMARHRQVLTERLRPSRNRRHFAVDIFNAFSWMKIYWFRWKFHWRLFPRIRLTIFQHWFRLWLDSDQATSHYLNQIYYFMMHICVTRPQWVKTSAGTTITVEIA